MNSIQEDYEKAASDYKDAVGKAGSHFYYCLNKAGLNLDTVSMELLVSLKAECSKKFNVDTLRKVLRDKEAHLLGWGWEYIRGLKVDDELDSSDTKLKTIRDSMIKNFSKMER